MTNERIDAILDEIADAQTIEELNALLNEGEEYSNQVFLPAVTAARVRLEIKPPVQEEPKVEVTEVDLQKKLVELMTELEQLKAQRTIATVAVPRISRKYKLLKTDVAWSTKPQVHAIMAILGAHAKPGDVLDEATIVDMMIQNERVLQTRQGGKRIWDYYKGDHNNGLMAHGNIEKV